MSIFLTPFPFGQLCSGSDTKSQLEFLTVLDSRSQVIKVLPVADVVGSGLIQALSRSLEFSRDETVLIALIKHIRKNVLTRKTSEYTACFLHNRGLANLLDIFVDFKKSDALAELILNILSSLASLAEFNRFVATTESYLIAIWRSLNAFSGSTQVQVSILNLLDTIVSSVDTEGAQFSPELRNCIERILNERYLQLKIVSILAFD